MGAKKIKDDIFWVGAVDWDRRLFDSLIPLPDGTSYNAYLVYGREKTALVDTVDPSMVPLFMANLEGVKSIDFIVSNHSEQDHSGAIPHVLEKYKNAKIVATPKGKQLLIEHLHIQEERVITVSDGETLSLGNKTLEFIHAPWVHWPETMFTYLKEDGILFSCDLFGSHLAASDIFYSDYWRICDASKRYYAEVMMPFRTTIHRHLEKLRKYQVDMIAPSHGPVHRDPERIVQSHRDWVSDNIGDAVVLPYVTMHGSTQMMADYLTDALTDKGVRVEKFNLAAADTGKFAMALVDSATLVIGSPTVLTGAHPLAMFAAFLANALKPKLKFASIIGSYGWGGKMEEQVKGMLNNLKLEMLKPVIIKGQPRQDDYMALSQLADEIANRHRALLGTRVAFKLPR